MSSAGPSSPMSLAELVGKGLFVDGDWVESKDQDPQGDVRLIQLADVGDGLYIDKSARFLTSAKARELRCTFLEAGDILVARMPDPLGRACIFPGDSRPCVTVVDVCIVRPGPDVDRRWLLYAINSPAFRAQIERHVKGTTRQRISRTNLATIQIEVPSFHEQRRIADILDKVDAIRRKRKESIALTEDLLRSAFLEMFGDPVTNPNGWPVRSLGTLGELDRGRSRHRPRNDPALLGGRHPLIQTGEVANCDGVIANYEQTYSDLGLAQSKLWPAGTLCITIAANIAKTGVLAFDACFPDSVVGFTPGSDATTEYIQYLLRFLQPILERQAPQVAQKNINLEILRALKVPTPPGEQQRAFTRIVAGIRQTRAGMRSAAQTSEKLFDSLMTHTFASTPASVEEQCY